MKTKKESTKKETMKYEKCGSTKFYIKNIDVTIGYDLSELTREEVEEKK